MAARPDENVAQVHVEPVMPLFLQLISKQAGVGALVKVQASTLWHPVRAIADATCTPCTSACMLTALKACAFDKPKCLDWLARSGRIMDVYFRKGFEHFSEALVRRWAAA